MDQHHHPRFFSIRLSVMVQAVTFRSLPCAVAFGVLEPDHFAASPTTPLQKIPPMMARTISWRTITAMVPSAPKARPRPPENLRCAAWNAQNAGQQRHGVEQNQQRQSWNGKTAST
jgi:hypothetical protein